MPAGWVAAAGTLISAGANVYNSSQAGKATDFNNATQEQLAGAQNTMLGDAESIANKPFTPYGGTLTAPMSGNQQQAYTLANRSATDGLAQADNAKATDQVDQVAANGWNADTASKYMNPYTKQVTDNAIENANKSYLQNLSSLNARAGQNSAFGGSRNAIESGTLASNNAMNIGTLTAKGNADAYDSAVKTWQADNQTRLNAASAYEAAGQDVTQMNSTQIADLLKTGGVAQVLSQTNLDNNYAQFMREQNWSSDQLQTLIQAVGTSKGNAGVSPKVASNVGNQLLGAGSTLAGLYGSGSSGSGSRYGSGAPSSYDISNDTAGAGDINVGDISNPEPSLATADVGDGG